LTLIFDKFYLNLFPSTSKGLITSVGCDFTIYIQLAANYKFGTLQEKARGSIYFGNNANATLVVTSKWNFAQTDYAPVSYSLCPPPSHLSLSHFQ
jgi:hypothetical protein